MVLSKRGGGAAMGSKPLPVPAPVLPSPYRPVDASWDSEEDAPGPRCGHTLTAVAGTGNPDSPDYVGPRLILFGGATAIEDGSSAFGGGIRLAGVTNAVHVYDVLSRKWKRYLPVGEPPSPRAAHTATAVGTMVVIQGGIGPAGHSTDDLYVLDLNHSKFKWHRVVVQGPGPGPRYGHVMDLIAQRYHVTVSGNDGKRTLSDAWALDTSQKPYRWQRLEPEGDMPSARMYATASARADGMLLPCGGRDSSGLPQSDAYGLLKHRDGRWEWTLAPGVSPSPRYQHAAVGLLFLYWASTGLFGGVFVFPTERELLAKGRSSNMYRLSAYYMSSTLCDTVAQIFYATIFYCIVYFMANFQRTASAFLLTLLGLYLVIFTAHGTGELIGAAVPDIRRTGLVASIVLLVFMITGGFYIQHMPVFIRWLKYVSFVFYGFRFVVKMQYSPHQIYDCTGPGGCKSIQSSPSFETMGLDGGMQEVWILILTALAYRIVAYFYLNKIKLL